MKKKYLIILAVLVLCLTAGFSILSLVNADSDPATVIVGQQLKFGESVYINYAVYFDNVPEGAETGLLVWKNAPADATYGNEEFLLKERNGSEEVAGKICDLIAFHDISAAEMGINIYAVSYIKKGTDITYSAMQKYSVLQYAYNKLGFTGEESTDENLKDLLRAMLVYGESVQTYTNLNMDRPVNQQFYQIKVEGGVLSDGTTSGLFLAGDEVTVKATASDFGSWVDTDGNYLTADETYTFTAGAENFTPRISNERQMTFVSNGDGTCYIKSKGTINTASVIIPSTSPSGDTVVTIADNAFKNYTAMTSIYIPETVTKIGDNAFDGCTGLTSIDIPSSVKYLGCEVFANATNLKTVYYNTSASTRSNLCNGIITTVHFNGSSIPSYAAYDMFDDSTCAINSVTIGSNVTTIESNALRHTKITSLVIPDTVTTIKDYAFQGCQSLASLSGLGGVTSMGYYTFSGCSSLTSVDIHSGIKEIGHGCFSSCTSLEAIVLPSTITTANLESTFEGCTSLISATLPSGVTVLKRTFYDCEKLATITIPSNVTSLDTAFWNCKALSSVKIPDSVTNLSQAFRGCISLTDVWIPSGTEKLGVTFYGCTSLTKINLPASMTFFGNWTFYGCTSLTHVFYEGTSDQFDSVEKGTNPYGTGFAGTIYFMSDTYEAGTWHYVEGVATMWEETIS